MDDPLFNSGVSIFKVNVVACNPRREEQVSPSVEARVDNIAHRFVATTTLAAPFSKPRA